jgi:hypothetical protein
MGTEGIQESYKLSPMQHGMLYHSIDADGSGVYCIHVTYSLRGPVQPSAFKQAWQNVVDRHAALRTSFHWKDVPEPYQAVHSRVDVPFEYIDWSALEASEQELRLTALIESGARRGFELDRPPLIRLSLIRTGDEAFQLVLSHHHLLLDGWCKPILFDEVFAFYRAAVASTNVPELPEPQSYRRYIDWLSEQDLSTAERFWRKELAGISGATPVLPHAPSGEPAAPDYDELGVELDRAATVELREYARSKRLTLNTLVLGTWGLVLGVNCGQNDIVFGATVNGRPADLSGADAMIGLFINTLPVRIQLPADGLLTNWLAKLQIGQARARDYDFTPLPLIQKWTAMPGGQRLFDSIVVFENNPGFGCERERHEDIEIADVRATIRNSLPLTLRCVPGPKLGLQLLYDGRRFARSAIDTLAEQVLASLTSLPVDEDARIGDKLRELELVASRCENARALAFQSAVRGRLRSARSARTAKVLGG